MKRFCRIGLPSTVMRSLTDMLITRFVRGFLAGVVMVALDEVGGW